jgi:hypothetical protein
MRKLSPGFTKMKTDIANVAEQKGYGNKNLDKEETYMYSSLNCFCLWLPGWGILNPKRKGYHALSSTEKTIMK